MVLSDRDKKEAGKGRGEQQTGSDGVGGVGHLGKSVRAYFMQTGKEQKGTGKADSGTIKHLNNPKEHLSTQNKDGK